MNLCKFLHFNDACPSCGKPLTLFMHVSQSALWKAEALPNGEYKFQQFLLKKETWSEDDFMTLRDLDSHFETEFNTSKLGRDSKTWQLFFFKVCNIEAFNDNKWDYDINLYDVCYYRSSPFYEFKNHPKDHKKWQLEATVPEHADLINRDESFVFKQSNQAGLEKVYALNLDYDARHTKLWYYTTTPEQRAEAQYEPKIFEKTDLPLMGTRPNFSPEGREKLISRLDGWILMS